VYTNWFSSPYINDVLQALERHSYNVKRAVAALKQHAPDARYERLSDSTVRAWFEKGTHTLLPSFQQQLDANKALTRGSRPPQMSVAVEEDAPQPLPNFPSTGNSRACRWPSEWHTEWA